MQSIFCFTYEIKAMTSSQCFESFTDIYLQVYKYNITCGHMCCRIHIIIVNVVLFSFHSIAWLNDLLEARSAPCFAADFMLIRARELGPNTNSSALLKQNYRAQTGSQTW